MQHGLGHCTQWRSGPGYIRAVDTCHPVDRPPMVSADLGHHKGDAGGNPLKDDGDTSRRRILVACSRCRKRKIKCSGPLPAKGTCSSCEQSGMTQEHCQFNRVNSKTVDWKPGSQEDANSPTLLTPRKTSSTGLDSSETVLSQAQTSSSAKDSKQDGIGSNVPFGYENSGIENYGPHAPASTCHQDLASPVYSTGPYYAPSVPPFDAPGLARSPFTWPTTVPSSLTAPYSADRQLPLPTPAPAVNTFPFQTSGSGSNSNPHRSSTTWTQPASTTPSTGELVTYYHTDACLAAHRRHSAAAGSSAPSSFGYPQGSGKGMLNYASMSLTSDNTAGSRFSAGYDALAAPPLSPPLPPQQQQQQPSSHDTGYILPSSTGPPHCQRRHSHSTLYDNGDGGYGGSYTPASGPLDDTGPSAGAFPAYGLHEEQSSSRAKRTSAGHGARV